MAYSQEPNILVIGSTHTFSEGEESEMAHEKPFNPTAIKNQYQSILAQDSTITGEVSDIFEDI